MATFEDVRALSLQLPAAEESTSYGTLAFKVRKKLFARMREEGDILVVKVDRDERAALIESEPEIYFTTPHYENYGYVLVRLEAVERDQLREILIESWRLAAPRKLHDELRD
jgi:hypothetical protein